MGFKGKFFTYVFFWMLIFGCVDPVHGQLSTIGREFYLGFMENNRIVPNRIDQASIIISASEDAKGIIRYTNKTISFSIKSGEQFVYDFPQDGLDIIHRSSGKIENLAVSIFADGNIAVHAFNFRQRSADGTVILPLSSLGKDYLVTAHAEKFSSGVSGGSNINYESTLLVVAVEDETDIEITTTTATVNTIPAGAPINVRLKKGETYQIKAIGDLTGTRVRVIGSQDGDCKNIAVFGGNKMTSVGTDCEGTTGDHLYQQAYPLFSWGKEYIHVPLKGRTSGEMVKVLASEDNTQIFINGVSQGNLNSGKFSVFFFGPEQLANITATKPIAVTVFAKSQWCNVQNGPTASNGDPTMITLSPNPQLIKSVAFSAVKVVGIINHYINIITKTGSQGKTLLDGVNVGNQFLPVPGNPGYVYAQVEVSEGVHTMTNPDGVIAYVYGSGFIESYGYSAGASLSNLNFKTEVKYDFEVEGDKVACLGETGVWKVIPDNPKFEIFEWTFGDGTAMQEGQEVDHLFEKPGIYEIKILAFTGDRACDQIEEAFFEVEVFQSSGKISGADNVCPVIDQVVYTFENFQNTARVIWEVTGGEIIFSDNYSAKIQWGNFDPDAKVIAIPVTSQGCVGTPMEMEVLINEAIEPDFPEGRSQVCFGESENFTYKVKNLIPDRKYQWFVTGGTIISGENTTEVSVKWQGVGSEGEIWFEEYSQINTSCGGESKRLKVKVNPPMEANLISFTEEICAGSNLGKIEVLAIGGTGDFRFEWSHDPLLKGPFAAGLGTGIYSVKVMDSGGCEIFFENLEISSSETFELKGNPLITNASCFDLADGKVDFELQGGTKPYRIDGFDFILVGNQLQVFNLPKGDQRLIVKDVVGCEFVLEVTIDSPAPITVDFKIEKFACSGLANGSLLAIPQGGVAPFLFFWDWENSTAPNLIDIPSGEYGLIVKDGNGCQKKVFGKMEEGIPILRMPTGFIPKDGLFQGVSNCDLQFNLWVYDKWGSLIYAGEKGWNGKIGDQEAMIGTYTYMIEYFFKVDGQKQTLQQRGAFTLLK
jgi:hypothetical protein